jgi:hypothetical protein
MHLASRLLVLLSTSIAVWACTAAPPATLATSKTEKPVSKTDDAAADPTPAATTSATTATTPVPPATSSDGDDDDDEDACFAKCEKADPGAQPIVEGLADKMYECVCGSTVCGKECGKTEWCVDGGTKLSDDGSDACSKCWAGANAAKCTDAFNAACKKDQRCTRSAPCYWACEGLDAEGH